MTSTVPPGRGSLHRYPGTSCLATISLSLWDKNHPLIGAPRIKLALWVGPSAAFDLPALTTEDRELRTDNSGNRLGNLAAHLGDFFAQQSNKPGVVSRLPAVSAYVDRPASDRRRVPGT